MIGDIEAGWRYAAVAAVFRPSETGTAELLFMRRTVSDDDPWSGQVSFPGGRHEAADASLEHTAARETLEEVGIDLLGDPACRRLGALDEIRARARREIAKMAIRPYGFVLDHRRAGASVADVQEVAAVQFVPLETLLDAGRRTVYDATRDGAAYRFPGIDLSDLLGAGPPLWGLTLHMTAEILGRVGLVDDVAGFSTPQPIV